MKKKDLKYKPIAVTKPFLPELEELKPYLEKIWETHWLTNQGEFHEKFERELAVFLGVPYVSLFTNGTLALLTAFQALNIKGEVITTPYTFAATAHALVWNNITPVFVDVEPLSGNINPNEIEKAITDNTSAILPVHVYGNPCNVDEIEKIVKKYKLKLIYDAAHAFGVEIDGNGILNYGDLSILSFHATKVFNTFEGGAIISHTKEMKRHIDDLKNFGFRDEVTVVETGINGKMNEFQAALGLVQLRYFKQVVEKRKKIADKYFKVIDKIDGIEFLKINKNVKWNYSYFPAFVESEYKLTRDELYDKFKKNNIYARRYFYPLISDMKPYKGEYNKINLPNAGDISKKVLCLPLYPDMTDEEFERIVNILKFNKT